MMDSDLHKAPSAVPDAAEERIAHLSKMLDDSAMTLAICQTKNSRLREMLARYHNAVQPIRKGERSGDTFGNLSIADDEYQDEAIKAATS